VISCHGSELRFDGRGDTSWTALQAVLRADSVQFVLLRIEYDLFATRNVFVRWERMSLPPSRCPSRLLTHSLCRWRVAAGAKPVDAELLGAVRKIFAPVDSELVCSDLEHLSLSNAIGTPDFTRCHTCISLIEPAYSSGRYCSGFGRREWETVALGQ